MKKPNKFKSKPKADKELASQFELEVKHSLPLSIQPDGSIVYKTYVIKQNKIGNWVLYHLSNRSEIEEFYLKTCALMAAKAYSVTDINKFMEIKRLDSKYWASYSDNQIYRKNIKSAKDLDRFLILLNKLEDSEDQAERYKTRISTMFKWSFV